MRISDWSSDVCSSDLPKRLKNSSKGEPSGKLKGMPGSPRGASTSWVEAMLTTAGLTFLASSEKLSGAGAAAARPLHTRTEAAARPAPQRWAALRGLSRSEEHTYELQSLMRHSYAY